MRIALVDASPKPGISNSHHFAAEVQKLLPEGVGTIHFRLKRPEMKREQLVHLTACDAVVLFFPLYADAMPSHLLQALMSWEESFSGLGRKPTLYAVVNCGFYEGDHARIVMDMLQCWCRRSRVQWGRGIGIGGGEMLGALGNVEMGKGPKTGAGAGLQELVGDIVSGGTGEPIYTQPNFPRRAFVFMAHLGWRLQARKNGVGIGGLTRLPENQ